MHGQDHGGSGLPGEVEVALEIAQDRHLLAHRRTRVGPSAVARVEPAAAPEVVLDELHVRVEAEYLMIDVGVLAYGLMTMAGTRKP